MKTLKHHMGVLENKCTSVEAQCGSDAYNPSNGKVKKSLDYKSISKSASIFERLNCICTECLQLVFFVIIS